MNEREKGVEKTAGPKAGIILMMNPVLLLLWRVKQTNKQPAGNFIMVI